MISVEVEPKMKSILLRAIILLVRGGNFVIPSMTMIGSSFTGDKHSPIATTKVARLTEQYAFNLEAGYIS